MSFSYGIYNIIGFSNSTMGVQDAIGRSHHFSLVYDLLEIGKIIKLIKQGTMEEVTIVMCDHVDSVVLLANPLEDV